MPDDVFDEVGCAFVLTEDDTELSVDELREHSAEYLANYKIPKRWELVDEMPVLPNTKIDRGALKERAAAMTS